LMEALAEVELNEGQAGLNSIFGSGELNLTADEQEELYQVLIASLGGDDEDEEMILLSQRLGALIQAHPPMRSSTLSFSGGAVAPVPASGSDVWDDLQEAMRRSAAAP
jgi:hypothetical protein